MNILLITTHLNIGGIGTYVTSLSKGLVKKGHRVYVVSSGGTLVRELEELEEHGAIHITMEIKTKSEVSPKVIFNIGKVSKIVEKNEIDIIHAQTRVTQFLAHFVSKICNITYVTTCHGFFKRRLGRRIFPCWGRYVIAISPAVRKHLIEDFGVASKKVKLILNGVDIDKFAGRYSAEEITRGKKELGFDNNDLIIGNIARLVPLKGHEFLLYAFRDVVQQIPNAKLLIVGSGKIKSELVKRTKELKIDKDVVFLEAVQDTAKILSIMDVFVYPCIEAEGLGLSIIEAMAGGKPIVATRVGGIDTVVKDGVNGILVAKNDTNTLSQAILNLLLNRQLASSMGEESFKIVGRYFSLDSMVGEVERAYREIIDHKP